MNLCRRIRAALLFWRCQPYTPGIEWTKEDAAAWLAFRDTLAGRRLGIILANQAATSAMRATAEKRDTVYECGYASGIRGTVAVLDSLLPEQISPAGAQTGTFDEFPSDEGAGAFAHLQP